MQHSTKRRAIAVLLAMLAAMGISVASAQAEDPEPVEPGCSNSQANDSTNTTPDRLQIGLFNRNNDDDQGENVNIQGNAFCGATFDGDDGGGSEPLGCTTSQTNDSTNSTGDNLQVGLVNHNNTLRQGNNSIDRSNEQCGANLTDGESPGLFSGDAPTCATVQENGSRNTTGDNLQAGLVNTNNVVVQGNNFNDRGNLGCGANHTGGDAPDCVTTQENSSTNSTGDSAQVGLVNINNVIVQGNNFNDRGNLECGTDSGGGGDGPDCATSQGNSSTNSTGDSAQVGLVNINNIGLQGNNFDDRGNQECGTTSGDGAGNADGCTVTQENTSTNSTGDSAQVGLVNIDGSVLQGNNIDQGGNAECGAIYGAPEDYEDPDGGPECATSQTNQSVNTRGESLQIGLRNYRGDAPEGRNFSSASTLLCGAALEENPDTDDEIDTGFDGAADPVWVQCTGLSIGNGTQMGAGLLGGLLHLATLTVQVDVAVLDDGLCGTVLLDDVLATILTLF